MQSPYRMVYQQEINLVTQYQLELIKQLQKKK
jgi:hypothetical protein